MNLDLPDKLYTSTQVADILGVSLRTLYRYMEDQKIKSMKTASGRHRFTRDQILDFLNTGQTTDSQEVQNETRATTFPSQDASLVQNQEQEDISDETDDEFVVQQPTAPINDTPVEPVVAAQQSQPVQQSQPTSDSVFQTNVVEQVSTTVTSTQETAPVQVEPTQAIGSQNIRYYTSEYTDLIELAKKTKETANAKDMEYAFTLYAGLSLHFLIKPFTTLHYYVNPEDMQIWKEQLRLVPEQKREKANVGLLINTDIVFVPTKEIGGFKVVDDKILLKDLSNYGEQELLGKFRQHLSSV